MHTIENIKLVKSILEQKNKVKFNIDTILLTELDTLTISNNNLVYYYGSLTIGNESNKDPFVFFDSVQQFKLEKNTKDYTLFSHLTLVAGASQSTLQGQFYGVVFTPTKDKNDPIDFNTF